MSSQLRRKGAAWCAVIALVFLGACAQPSAQPGAAPKNIIILFGDGAAVTQWEFGRYSSRALRSNPLRSPMSYSGRARSASPHPSADSPVTDSAAAGFRDVDGIQRHETDGDRDHAGRQAGSYSWRPPRERQAHRLVTTATVHERRRSVQRPREIAAESQSIVDQYSRLEPDVLIGGGPNISSRKGGRRQAQGRQGRHRRVSGPRVAGGAQDPEPWTCGSPTVLGLFADEDMDLEIDRDAGERTDDRRDGLCSIEAAVLSNVQRLRTVLENETSTPRAIATTPPR